jgi:hypothetical protein
MTYSVAPGAQQTLGRWVRTNLRPAFSFHIDNTVVSFEPKPTLQQ